MTGGWPVARLDRKRNYRVSEFLHKLDEACRTNRSLLCVGLDPDPARIPVSDAAEFNRAIVDATADLVCAYKPNLAFYEAMGIDGLKALEHTVAYIKASAPDAVIIGDAKRGDVGDTAEAYARAMFDVWGFDAVTVNAYLGGDTVRPFLEYGGRGVFIVCRTSNPGARDFQDLKSNRSGEPLYRTVAAQAMEWSEGGNVGLVVGATYPSEMKQLREVCPDLPFLIPGVGAQGGDLKDATLNGVDSNGRRAVINASRSVLYASSDSDYAQAARKEATNLRDGINAALAEAGLGWS